MTNEMRSGGCLCGKVRYSVAWPPLSVATCQCKHCQKQSGSAISIIALVPAADLEVTGELVTFADNSESGGTVYRRFCDTCGSPLFSDLPALSEQGLRFIKAGTLDDTSGLSPTAHYWTSSAQEWVALPTGGERFSKQ